MENITKEEYINNIKQWIVLDSQLKTIHEKTKKIREMKNNLTHQICNYTNDNKIKNKIRLPNGELVITEKKEYSPLTFGYIEECLKNIVSDEEQIVFILDYLKQNRKITIVPEIRKNITDTNLLT